MRRSGDNLPDWARDDGGKGQPRKGAPQRNRKPRRTARAERRRTHDHDERHRKAVRGQLNRDYERKKKTVTKLVRLGWGVFTYFKGPPQVEGDLTKVNPETAIAAPEQAGAERASGSEARRGRDGVRRPVTG